MTPLPFLTIRDVLRYAVSRFNAARVSFGHGSTNAYDEAAYLILHTLNLPLDSLEPFLDARLLAAELKKLLLLIERRAKDRVPAAYLTRESWMHGYAFYVDERVIVPRSPIGELLRDQLAPWIENPLSIRAVLDLCTGSGCLAVLAADAFPNARVDAVDISADALSIAHENVAKYGFESRITLYCGDLYSPLPARRYDLIVANPPYITEAGMLNLPAEYQHEPYLALAGGEDGMSFVRHILAGAPAWLAPKGMLVLETGYARAPTHKALAGFNPIWLSTSAGDDCVMLLQAADFV